jgi:hypothetical protein
MDKQRLFRLRTMPYEEYLKTSEWLAKRQQVLERDEGCRNCNAQENLEVHHRTYARRGYEDLRDLTVLCESCHEHFHQKKGQSDIMGRTYIAPPDPNSERHGKTQWEYYLIGLLLHDPSLTSYVCGIINPGDFMMTETREVYSLISSAYQQHATDSSPLPAEQWVPAELLETIEQAKKRAESNLPENHDGYVQTIIRCAVRLKRNRLLQTQTEMTYQIDAAVRRGDQEAIQRLSQQLSVLQKELRTIYSATLLQG